MRSGTCWFSSAAAAISPSWSTTLPEMKSIEVKAARIPDADRIITPDALGFLERLARQLTPRRKALLQRRKEVQRSLRGGGLPGFLPETRAILEGNWTVGPAPADLDDRRVEITGPVERKMMINALNSGARVFMADFEDACSPTWGNVVAGQRNLIDAVRGTISLESHLEARLWNDAFRLAQDELGIPQGTIRATVLIETILAAFEADEILYEL